MNPSSEVTSRDDIFKYAKEQYGTEPEYLWMKFPTYAILRHHDNKKWYGAVLNVPKSKLGLLGEGSVEILDVKCDPVIIGSLRMKEGILPGYHMSKGNWITVLLDGTVEKNMVFSLLDESFRLTGKQ
ncbi:MAG: MmcQ/YjbR family DNA-binding protein [Methanocorpusculum sp.]|nr:MmcQ/YjbR family DNA-binding protein [Methanocorpusculum sp.]